MSAAPHHRYMFTLECGHRLVSDDDGGAAPQYCPACNLTYPIVKCEPWDDPDV